MSRQLHNCKIAFSQRALNIIKSHANRSPLRRLLLLGGHDHSFSSELLDKEVCGWLGHLHLLIQSNSSGRYDFVSNARTKTKMGHMGAKGSCTCLRFQIRALHDWNESAYQSDARHEEWCSGARHALTSVLKGFYKGADLTERTAACHQDNLIHCVRQSAAIAISTNTFNSVASIWPSKNEMHFTV